VSLANAVHEARHLWMDIMFLVAGLVVAGLVGIAAAFYFSIRSGNRRDKRLRSARAGRAGTDRRPASRSDTARPDLAGQSRRAAGGGGPITTFRPAAVSSRTPRAKADTGPDPLPAFDQAPADGRRAAPGATATRRRVGFRKGANLDEELWPAETFGGVSDEQFWDDLASDKPLATTARTAQQDSPGKNRPPVGAPVAGLDSGPATDPKGVQARANDRKRDDRGPGRARRGPGSGGHAAAQRTGPGPAAERTAVQPAYAATQPVQSMKPPSAGATQPVRAAASTSQPMSTGPVPRETAPVPRETAPVPRETAPQPTETRRRRPSSAEEDPLTSAAFSLRPSGPVDGRSSLRARNTSKATPPYGQDYGYGRADPAAQASEPRRHNGTGSHARPDGAGEGTRTARQVYPRHSHRATGGYPVTGSYQGNGNQTGSYPVGGYPGNGHRGNGHRAPYNPRDDYRQLTPRR
jgi:hypothetical protein